MPSPAGYSRAQIRLHWIVAALIVLQFVLHEPIAEAWDALREGAAVSFNPLIAAHVFGGLAVLAFALWRLALRARRGAPPPPQAEHPALKLAAKVAHASLYALMVAMPVTGAAAWFGGVDAAADAHEAMKPLLLGLVALHVAASLYHQFVLRTDLMSRMRKPAS